MSSGKINVGYIFLNTEIEIHRVEVKDKLQTERWLPIGFEEFNNH